MNSDGLLLGVWACGVLSGVLVTHAIWWSIARRTFGELTEESDRQAEALWELIADVKEAIEREDQKKKAKEVE